MVHQVRGKLLQSTGFSHGSGLYLFIEEVLFLMERGDLELVVDGVPASLQEAYALVDKPSRTKGLHELVKRFPMTSFHKDTQRFAVGTQEALIIVYDLRTATKWRVLQGHQRGIAALSFSPKGSVLGSYSAEEATVRSWDTGASGFFGDILSIQGRCLKEVRLQRTARPGSLVDVLQHCNLLWTANRQAALAREDRSQLALKI